MIQLTSYHHKDMDVLIPIERDALHGNLCIPENAIGTVIFAHGSGSSRLSPRNQFVAQKLNQAGLATLLVDLLTEREEISDFATSGFRFDINLLTDRLLLAEQWIATIKELHKLNIGYFGASTGAAAALRAAEKHPNHIKAIVSRGGRPDLAGNILHHVQAPTLLIVGGNDLQVIQLNEKAFYQMHCKAELKIIPCASHLFEEPGKLEEVADISIEWFRRYLL